MAEKKNQENETIETTALVENDTAAIEEETVEAENEAAEAEDEAAEAEDEAVEAEDEAAEAEDEAVEAEDEAAEVEDDAVETEDEVVEAEDEAVEAEDEAAEAEDEAAEAEDEAAEVEDEAAEAEDEAVEAEDEAAEVEDEAVEAEDEAVEAEDEAAEVEDEAVEVEDDAVETADEVVETENEAVEAEDEAAEVEDDAAEAEDDDEAAEADDETDEIEDEAAGDEIGIDEDDYLDYDEDEVRPKKLVSGKAATVTMLLTFLCSILVVAGAFVFATRFQRGMDISVVSYTDRFNSCRTNDFSYGDMLGIGTVSYSDKETTLSAEDVKALKSGKTVTKFDGMTNISAKTRFGKLVSLDISFNPSINETSNPSGYFALLAGNAISGLLPGVESSDTGFMAAYTILNYSAPMYDQPNVYCYYTEDMAFCLDYTKATQTEQLNDLTIHVESAQPHYLDASKIDTSWLPWHKEPVSDSDVSDDVYGDDADVSDSDI